MMHAGRRRVRRPSSFPKKLRGRKSWRDRYGDVWTQLAEPLDMGHSVLPAGAWENTTGGVGTVSFYAGPKNLGQHAGARALVCPRERRAGARRAAPRLDSGGADGDDPPPETAPEGAFVPVLIPRAALRPVLPPPACVTQETVESVIGMPREIFMAAARNGVFAARKCGKRWIAWTADVARCWGPSDRDRCADSARGGAAVPKALLDGPLADSCGPSVENEKARLIEAYGLRPRRGKND